ncbi:uncharacterized protein LOC126746596 [Anthonomus grandis grandis]|uniref:uncharacterized protein LOC126746596 n=1 Tax=Anthonomus grandis grandis TaxID=2921223 RepID=UPI0021658881|nr:uncharacterized protein LOC126746596 [Anthonomus grandis grandis]
MASPTTLEVQREVAARLEHDDILSNMAVQKSSASSRRNYMFSVRGDRSRSEQGPHPIAITQHMWTGAKKTKKRTSAPQMGANNAGGMRTALILRSRRSWPVAPMAQYRWQQLLSCSRFSQSVYYEIEGGAKRYIPGAFIPNLILVTHIGIAPPLFASPDLSRKNSL